LDCTQRKSENQALSETTLMKLPLSLPPREAKLFDAVGFGENSLDLVGVVSVHPEPDTKQQLTSFHELPGGQAAVAMVACARLGWRTRYVGSFGTDARGSTVEGALAREGVEVVALRRAGARSRVAIVLVDSSGHRTVLESRDPALAWRASEVDPGVAASGRLLLVDGRDIEASIVAARAAQAAGVPTLVDVEEVGPGVDALLGAINLLVVAEAFPSAYTGVASVGDALRRLATKFRPALAVVTLGAEGSLALCGGVEIHTPAFPVTVVDATGAGDAFRGGLMAAWLRFGSDGPVETLLEYANAVAALNCLGLGALGGLPTRPAVDALVTGAKRVRSN
jgi:sulfofructose kinase